jgi:hypothetical protein
LGQRVDHDGGDGHHPQRHDAAAQLAPKSLHANHGASCAGDGGTGMMRKR